VSEETKPTDESGAGQDGEPSSSCNALLSVYRFSSSEWRIEKAVVIAEKRNGWKRIRIGDKEQNVQFNLDDSGAMWKKWHRSPLDTINAALKQLCKAVAGGYSFGQYVEPRLDLVPALADLIRLREEMVADANVGGGI